MTTEQTQPSEPNPGNRPEKKKSQGSVIQGLIALAIIFYVATSPALQDWAIDVGIGVLKLLALALCFGIVFHLLRKWADTVAEQKEHGTANLLAYLSRYFPLQFVLGIPQKVFEPGAQLKELKNHRWAWSNALLILVSCIAATSAIEASLDLPPTQLSAAGAIYYVSDQDSSETLATYWSRVENRLANIEVEPKDEDLFSSKVRHEFLPVILREDFGLEVHNAVMYPGISLLNVYLEWTYGIRSAGDVEHAFRDTPDDRLNFIDVVNEFQTTHLWEKVLIDGLLIVWPGLFAIVLWAGVPGLTFRVALGSSLYLYVALVLAYEFVYIAAASVVIMAAAETLAFVAWLITFEMWVIEILPEELELPDLRCGLVGNGAMLLTTLTSMWVTQLVV